jgi:hypothetical protein
MTAATEQPTPRDRADIVLSDLHDGAPQGDDGTERLPRWDRIVDTVRAGSATWKESAHHG